MNTDVQVMDAATQGELALRGSFHPSDNGVQVNSRKQFVRQNGMVVNSILTEDEWVEFDNAVMEASRYPLRVVSDFRSRGLTKRLGGVGTLVSRWYMSSEITAASVNMTGRGRAERDLPDTQQSGVPVPVIFKEFAVDFRTLDASRRMGDGIDTTTLVEAVRVVAEGLENIVVAGNTSVVLGGATIYGLRTHPNRLTDTAANYGGGDWGTIANVVPTIAGAINAANGQHNYGPFVLYVSQTQYNEAALSFYPDGSGDTPLDRIRQLPMIEDVRSLPVDSLPAGQVLLLQPTREYFALAEALPIQVREWTTGDGMETMFKVLTIATVEVKARYGTETGIVHITGA